jgi:hypothetical protein
VLEGLEGDKTFLPDTKGFASGGRITVYREAGDMENFYRSAELEFQRLNEIKNTDTDVYGGPADQLNLLAWMIADPSSDLRQKDYDFAVKVASRAVELELAQYAKDGKFVNTDALDTLAWSYLGKGDKERAVQTERIALALAIAQKDEARASQFRGLIEKMLAK